MSEAQSNKRRAAGPHDDEPAKTKGRLSKAVLASQVPSVAMNRVQARRLLEEHPKLEEPSEASSNDLDAFYREHISWHVKSQWGPEDDDAVEEEWERSPQKAVSTFNKSQHGALLAMFKVCMRLYRSTPIEIFSPYHSLRYYPASNSRLGNVWVYNKSFCDEFKALMVHPIWEGDTDLLTTALQWTVICRMRDDRIWLGSAHKRCPALGHVYKEVRRCHKDEVALPCSYHEMHVSERQRILEAGESPGEWSDLFYQIGELASNNPATEADDECLQLLGLPVLPVTIQDLRLLTEALNSTNLRPEWNYSVEEALKGWKVEAFGKKLPDMDSLSLVFEIAWKDVFRYVRVTKRDGGADRNPPRSIHAHVGEENESEPKRVQRTRKLRRRQSNDESDKEQETIPRPNAESHHGDNEDGAVMGESWEGDLDVESFPKDPTQRTSGIDVLLSRGPTPSSKRLPARPTPSVYPSFHEQQMASEISALKEQNAKLCKQNTKLYEQNTKLYELAVKSQQEQKEQREIIVSMNTQLDSVQCQLKELRQTEEAPIQDNYIQR
ncbi:hypothetical protein F52700_2467 [Fusarium sp. NRRL 52700]|nr:hypothetical protein F52700_2467 [Fusarium sp. NRRL 52700]